ncbi:MAG TPA: hypothetical protein VGB52_02395 [Actinomycetota bacterium]
MRARSLVSAFGLAALVAVFPADAGPTAAAIPGSQFSGYGTPLLVTTVDGAITFTNADPLASHDLVAWQAYGSEEAEWCGLYPVGRCPLFWTRLISFTQSATVQGLDAVTPGQMYTFYCSIHPLQMKGTLIVVPA